MVYNIIMVRWTCFSLFGQFKRSIWGRVPQGRPRWLILLPAIWVHLLSSFLYLSLPSSISPSSSSLPSLHAVSTDESRIVGRGGHWYDRYCQSCWECETCWVGLSGRYKRRVSWRVGCVRRRRCLWDSNEIYQTDGSWYLHSTRWKEWSSADCMSEDGLTVPIHPFLRGTQIVGIPRVTDISPVASSPFFLFRHARVPAPSRSPLPIRLLTIRRDRYRRDAWNPGLMPTIHPCRTNRFCGSVWRLKEGLERCSIERKVVWDVLIVFFEEIVRLRVRGGGHWNGRWGCSERTFPGRRHLVWKRRPDSWPSDSVYAMAP